MYRLGFATAISFAEGLTEKANLINPLPRDYQAAVKLIARFSDQTITLFDAVTALLAMQMSLPIWTYDRHFDVIRVQVWR